MFDIVIRNGTIYDGSGAPARRGELAIAQGRIAALAYEEDGKGARLERGRQELDADGQIVAPGFVDVHTHYDGQITWDPWLQPSSFHGVTTAVMGNCGVGFAPCHPDKRDWLIGLMEGVEDIPGTVLSEGLQWGWESFPQFLDFLENRPLALDVGAQLPHSALRAYVMGQRAADLEPANADDIAKMQVLLKEALEAGALGFTTSRTEKHRDKDGKWTPTYQAEARELRELARVMGDCNKGVIQLIADCRDFESDWAMVRAMVEASGRPLSITIEQDDRFPTIWRSMLDAISAAAKAGLPMKGQVPARATGVVMGLDCTLCPFLFHDAYRDIAERPLAEKVRALKDPARRAKLCAERPQLDKQDLIGLLMLGFHKMWEMGDPPDYEPDPKDSVAALAERSGKHPYEIILDIFLKHDGKGLIYFPIMNYTKGSLADVHSMLTHPHTAFGLSDGGAHCGILCDASFPTTFLTHWGRDRTRGPKLPLEFLIAGQTSRTAALVGLHDRGLLRPGWKADVNVIDFEGLRLEKPEIVRDLPAGGKRLVQKSRGYVASIVNGQVAFREGKPTDVLAGSLLRGARPAPASKPARSAAE